MTLVTLLLNNWITVLAFPEPSLVLHKVENEAQEVVGAKYLAHGAGLIKSWFLQQPVLPPVPEHARIVSTLITARLYSLQSSFTY